MSHPIVSKMESLRHLEMNGVVVLEEDIPWKEKKDTSSFQGTPTGFNLTEDMYVDMWQEHNFTAEEACIR